MGAGWVPRQGCRVDGGQGALGAGPGCGGGALGRRHICGTQHTLAVVHRWCSQRLVGGWVGLVATSAGTGVELQACYLYGMASGPPKERLQ